MLIFLFFCVLSIFFSFSLFFFFNDTATTEIYTLSLHDALPIYGHLTSPSAPASSSPHGNRAPRSEEHTSELQSRRDLVCRLLLEKKKNRHQTQRTYKNKNTLNNKYQKTDNT